ncbi:GntR family transcriptional regulator [Novosphingobium profundi]|uniref:GntR family transcriptional regulator n=1 Tax=Novosphingobium profundi TaxID=1774954 RepID=UPI001BDB6BA2|nr:GntR family transcriptional regulator [Novosphingobium profundi]
MQNPAKPDMSIILGMFDPEPDSPHAQFAEVGPMPDVSAIQPIGQPMGQQMGQPASALEREGFRVAFPLHVPVGAGVLDRESAVPLYYQIYLRLRDEILCGQRPYGSVMPTENAISDLFEVSRITARRVMKDLAENGYIQRQRSKAARVVFQTPAKPVSADIDNAVDSLLSLNARTKVRVMSVETRPSTDIISEALKVPPGSPVVRVTRVRLLDDLPIGLIVSYVTEELASLMTVDRLEGDALLSVLKASGFVAHRAEQTIGAMLADASLVEALGVEPLSAVLRVTRTVFDRLGVPFLRTYAHYRSDRFNVHLSLESGQDE